MRQVNLPLPPNDSYLQRLVSRLYDLFYRIEPASGWKDLLSDITAAKVGVSAPTWSVFKNGVYAYKFDAAQDNEVQVALHIPHDMAFSYTIDTGEVVAARLYPHIHWSSAGTDTGNVVFKLEYTYAKAYGDGTFPATQTVTMVVAAPGASHTHEIAETPDADAIGGEEFEPDGVIKMRVYRAGTDAADTCTDDIFIHYADLHYYSDGLLTNERNRNRTGALPWTKQATI